MEPTQETPREPAGPPAAGELVVQNGRLSGTRRPLTLPLTLIGRSDACDVRLNVDGVEPLHCALVHGPDGVVLRDLAGGVLVNDAPPGPGPLHDGDTVTVGPFSFLLRLPEPGVGQAAAGKFLLHELEALEREKEALRVQAAAVAAQQAEVTEVEIRLEQRRGALEQQEQQLAQHLEEKRQRLLELQGEVREGRVALQNERKAYQAQSARELHELERGRKEVAADRQLLQAERRRLGEFRQRLKKRWHQQLTAERATLRRREEELARQRHGLEQEAERLEKERAAFVQTRLRVNGDLELGRRKLQAGWDELHQQQRHWLERQGRERIELQERVRALDDREAGLADAERDLEDQKHHWERVRHNLQKEAEGLENRVRNQRRKLADVGQELLRREAGVHERAPAPGQETSAGDPPAPAAEAAAPTGDGSAVPDERFAVLERLASEVADQRLHLVEQCARFAEIQQRWRRDHEDTAAELEAAGLRLAEREQELTAREQALEAGACALRQRHEEAFHARQHLEGWLARLATREATWEGERDRLLAHVQAREDSAQKQLAALLDIRRRWGQRRRQEAKQLRAAQEECERLRQQYLTLWAECFRRCSALEQEKRAVAERSLAMEQFRLELLGQSVDSAAGERRLEKLRRRWSALSVAAGRRLAQERRALEAEGDRLQELANLLEREAAVLALREEELASRQADWEQEQALRETEDARLRQELQSLQGQRDVYERQLRQVRDEVERVARGLIDGAEPPMLTVAQAA
jgi:hypothetical protein